MSMLVADPQFTCGAHRALIYELGGQVLIGELTPLLAVRWQRIRDDISTAEIAIGTDQCCDLLGDLRTIAMELHLIRNDDMDGVWEGPITRIEYEWDVVRIFAEDILWVAKRRVLEVGYNQSYPNIGNVIDRMHWLLAEQCYPTMGDHWNMIGFHLNPIHHSAPPPNAEPRTTRVINAYQVTIWEDFDKYAEDMGADYTVVRRDVFYWDNHLAWSVLPPLDEAWISQFPRIVEYGNELYLRAFVTNGRGYAGHAGNPDLLWAQLYGGPVDLLITNTEEGEAQNDPPTKQELASWTETAAHLIDGKAPAPVSVLIPANTTLMPGSPWTIETLIPGAWFEATVTRMCRTVSEWQRLHEVVVTESAPTGEIVQFSAISAPLTRIDPT